MKNAVLVVGGAGYIGSHVTKQLLQKNLEVIVFDNLSNGDTDCIEKLKKIGKLTFIKGDLRDYKEIRNVFEKYKFSAVFHFAGYIRIGESMESPFEYFHNNVFGSLNLLKVMSEFQVKKIIYSSTCAVYGEPEYLPVDEQHRKKPSSVYGESKLMVESLLKWYDKIFDIKFILFRYFNVCGSDSDGLIGDNRKPVDALVQSLIKTTIQNKIFPLTFENKKTQDGSPIRDFIDVEDLAIAHYLGLVYLEKNKKSNIFNLGTGKGYSVMEVISRTEEVLGKRIVKRKSLTREGEIGEIFSTFKKANSLLGWSPTRSIDESIKNLNKWYTSSPRKYD